jgi:hypothetical protein
VRHLCAGTLRHGIRDTVGAGRADVLLLRPDDARTGELPAWQADAALPEPLHDRVPSEAVNDRALSELPPEDQATITRWLALLGFEVDELDAVPPLRLLIDVVASALIVRRLSPPLRRDSAWATAGELIGRRGLIRRWYAWQARAAESADREDELAILEATSTEHGT